MTDHDQRRTHWLVLGLAIVAVAVVAAAFAIAFRKTYAGVIELLGGHDVVSLIAAAPWWERIALPAGGG